VRRGVLLEQQSAGIATNAPAVSSAGRGDSPGTAAGRGGSLHGTRSATRPKMLATGLLLQLATAQPPMPPPPAPVSPPAEAVTTETSGASATTNDPPPLNWMVRFGLGVGARMDSEQNDVLNKEGYGGARMLAFLDASMMMQGPIGLGVFGGYGYRSSSPSGGGPTLTESTWLVGVQAPILLWRARTIELLLVPRFGRAWTTLSFHDAGTPAGGFTYGGEFSLLFPLAHIGFSAGFFRAPTAPTGGAKLNYDAGSVYLALTGVIDG
jgi:hypothetical protein